ncbi:MAG: VWA domain-containing protein [Bryobacteraceae bacterium]
MTANSAPGKCAVAAAATLLCAFPSAAETQPVKLNKLNVVALDAKGQPVTGLTSADFRLLEDGKPQNIAFFRFTGDRPLLAKPDPGEYSNRAGAAPHVTVVLIDLFNEPIVSETTIGREVGDSLKNLESGDGLYLYILTPRGELHPIRPLPKPDTEVTPDAESWTQNVDPTLQSALRDLIGLRRVDDFDLTSRFDMTMDAMRDLGSQMAQASGRKSLVWVTHGIPLIGYSTSAQSGVNFTNRVRWFSERLEQSQIVVYTAESMAVPAAAETLDEFTGITGGREYSSSRAGEAIQQARTDSRANYEIAYYAAPTSPDEKHRKIRLTCGHKEVRLQTARVFYPVPPRVLPNGFTPSGFHFREVPREVDTAAHSPFDSTEIGIRASVSSDPVNPQNTSSGFAGRPEFVVHIDAADLLPRPAPNHGAGKVSVAFATYDEGLRQPSAPILYSLTPEQLGTATHGEIDLRYAIAIGPEVRKVRAIVFDEALGAVGSVTIPIQH